MRLWMDLYEQGHVWFAVVGLAVDVLAASWCTVHILLTKESPRSSAGWIAVVWLSPLVGIVAYLLLGINRIRRAATRLRSDDLSLGPDPIADDPPTDLPGVDPHSALSSAIGRATGAPLVQGNRVEALVDGNEAYPAMLEAIDGAERSVAFLTFLFDGGVWGQRFADALLRAHQRGVEVRMLVDGVGYLWFSRQKNLRALRRHGVPVRRFMWGVGRVRWFNLRNHRKILVVDGRIGFTGGMNVRDSFVHVEGSEDEAHHDLHCRAEGPIVRELMRLFAVDWAFTTSEQLVGDAWFPALAPAGEVVARVIADGPDENMNHAELAFHAAIATAQHRIGIVTPYFLPEAPLIYALNLAVARGVQVTVLIPNASNQWLVDLACRADLPTLLDGGVEVYGSGGPFDHSKLMVVDDGWACLGSANWDPRSLRLNFEMLLEVYDAAMVDRLEAVIRSRVTEAVRFDAETLRARPLARRLLERAARLFKPYL